LFSSLSNEKQQQQQHYCCTWTMEAYHHSHNLSSLSRVQDEALEDTKKKTGLK